MSDYIAREEAKTALGVEAEISTAAETALEDAIDGIPAADVAPVVHGSWRSNGIPDSMLSACSVCGFGCGTYSFRYCPNCGARMDGENDEV